MGHEADKNDPYEWLVSVMGYGLVFALIVGPIAAWLTHVYVSLMAETYLLLIAGAVFFPVGVIHGLGVWFGVF